MTNSTQINLVTNPELEKLFQRHTDLKKGDRLEGKIKEVRPDGKAVVDFGKFQAAVELKIPVEEGDVIHLVVVEKGKQLKLKVEYFESGSGNARQQQTQSQIKPADLLQERAIEELRSKIDQLVRNEDGTSSRSQSGTGTQQLKEINTQLGKLKEDLQSSESKAPLPKELKQDIGKLLENTENTLKKLDRLDSAETARRLEELAKAIKDLRSALDSHKEFREVRDRITKQVDDLKSLLKDSQMPAQQKENYEAVMKKISDAGERIAQLKSADQAQELRRIVSEEIKPNLQEALKIAERQATEQTAGAKQAAVEMKHQLEITDRAVDMSLQKLPPPAKDIDLLAKNLRQVLNKIEDTPDRAQITRELEAFQKDISRELIKLKEQFQAPGTRESLPKDIQNESEVLLKNAANALRQLQKTESGDIKSNLESLEKIEAVAKAVKNIRTALDYNSDVRDTRDSIVKQIQEIKSALEKADIPLNKEVKTAIEKLSEAADKIARLKTSEQLPELRRIVSEEIKPNLSELKENLAREAVVPGSEKAIHVAEQIKRVEILQKEIDIALPKLSAPEIPARDIERQLNDFSDALRRLSESPALPIAEKPPEPTPVDTFRNDLARELLRVEEQLQARTAEGKPAVSQETRVEVEYLMKNSADILRRLPQTQVQSIDTETAEKLEILSKAVRNVRTTLEATRNFNEVRDRIAKELTELKTAIEKADIPLKKEAQAALTKLSEAAEKISNLKSPDQIAELKRIVSEEVKPNLSELQKALNSEQSEQIVPDTAKSRQLNELSQQVQQAQKEIDISLTRLPSPPAQTMEVQLDNVGMALNKLADAIGKQPDIPSPPDTTNETRRDVPQHEALTRNIGRELINLQEYVETPTYRGEDVLPENSRQETAQLLKDIEIALQRLPESDRAEMTEHLKSLSRAVKNYRTSLDIRRDFQEVRDDMNKEIQRLKELVGKNKDLLPEPLKKDIEAQIEKLSEAADKMARLKGPEQITELRRIIAQEIKPTLKAIDQSLTQNVETSETRTQQSEQLQQQTQAIETLRNEARQISENAEKALQKLYPAPPRELSELVKNVESALYKIQPPPPSAEAAENARFSENIQNLYDNIKTALRMLQANIQVSGNKLELPEEIRQIFQDLQANLKTADTSEVILEQISQLKTLVEESGLPFDKMIEKIVDTLDGLLSRISQLKADGQHQEIRNLIQNQLKPFLGTLSEIFNDPKLTADSAHPQKIVAIRQMLQSLSSAVDQSAAPTDSKQPFDLSKLSQLTEQLAGLPKSTQQTAGTSTANLKASENIQNLSQNIEELLSKLPENISNTGNGAVTDKIRSLLSTLRSHFEPLDISDSAMKLVPKLKSLVENSGIFFEKKISDILSKLSDASTRMKGIQTLEQLPEFRHIIENDIKPNLLQLKEFLNNERLAAQMGKGKTLDSIRNAVEELLSNIGTQQEKAADSQAQQNPVQIFSFHLPIKDEEPAELKVFYNRSREKDSPDEYKLSLLLEMSKLGEVRSDFFNLKDDLNITFYVHDQSIKDFFDQNLYEIEDVLEPVFKNLNLNVIVSTEKIAEFESESKESQPTQVLSDKAVDVKI
jgi:DNA repair exonuclease SbcCD ATPase subunit